MEAGVLFRAFAFVLDSVFGFVREGKQLLLVNAQAVGISTVPSHRWRLREHLLHGVGIPVDVNGHSVGM